MSNASTRLPEHYERFAKIVEELQHDGELSNDSELLDLLQRARVALRRKTAERVAATVVEDFVPMLERARLSVRRPGSMPTPRPENPEDSEDSEDQDGSDGELSTQNSRSYFAPPPSDILRDYENIVPGSVDRMLRMVEQQQLHRHQLQVQIVVQGLRAKKAGQLIAAVVMTLSVAAGTYLYLREAEIAGAIMGGLGVLAPIVAYLVTWPRNQNMTQKLEMGAKEAKQ